MSREFERIDKITKVAPEALLAGLKTQEVTAGVEAAVRLASDANRYGLSITQYLDAAIEPSAEHKAMGINSGYEAALIYLNLPVKDDYKNHVSLQAAADTFGTQPGTRILFPEVVSDMLTWKQGPQDQFVSVAPLISQTRTVSGTNELINMQLDENGADLSMKTVAEGANIPLISITQSERAVKFYKVGKGYKFTYEFARRASIDILTPFVNRMNRQFEIDKVNVATNVIVNGDGVAGGITIDAETAFGGTNGTLDYQSLLKWLVSRMAAGYPIDTLIMNYATYGQFITLFEPVSNGTSKLEAVASRAGISFSSTVLLNLLNLNLAIAPNVADSTFIGINKSETLEELVEAGSNISENERLIRSQHVMFVKSLNIGYNLITEKARRGFSYAS